MHLSTAYFPPIQYFCKILKEPNIWIESQENFIKQSYRNRCVVMNSNGRINLSVPVKRANSTLPITQIEIDYNENWQRQHYRTLTAGYGASPFFEFYIDDFKPIFEEKIPFLWQLNNKIIDLCSKLIQIPNNTKPTTKYEHSIENDFRNSIHPKKRHQKEDPTFIPLPYWQPFSDTYGFQENLSILDLLFNMGTESEIYLLRCIS